MDFSPNSFIHQKSSCVDYPFQMCTRTYPTQIRNNPHPFKVRSVKGFLGLPTQVVETEDDYHTVARRTVRQFIKDSLNRGDWKYKETYVKKTKDLDSILALQYFTGLQSYSFKEDYLPYLGYREYFSDWRKQLRRITEITYRPFLETLKEKDEVTPQVQHPNEWLNGQRPQQRSKTLYSETGRLVTARKTNTKNSSAHRLRCQTSCSLSLKPLPSKVEPDFDHMDAVVFMLLADLLQTQSVHLIQSWLSRSSERERALITSMLQAAISKPQDNANNEIQTTSPKTSDALTRSNQKTSEKRNQTASNKKEDADILVIEANDADDSEKIRPPTSSTFKNKKIQDNAERSFEMKNWEKSRESMWSQQESIKK